MPYSEILSLLDAEIARLEKARDLLAQGAEVPVRRATRERTAAATETTVDMPARTEEVQVKKLQPRRSYGPRPRRARPATEEGALRSAVPDGPVFVAAGNLRRPEEEAAAAAITAAAEPAAPTWRAGETRKGDDLLQRFMQMGQGPHPAEAAK